MTLQTAHGRGTWTLANRVALSRLGRWQVVVDLDGKTLSDSSIDVVTTAAGVENRPPHAISAALRPASPTAHDVVECLVSTSLVVEDPDYDIVHYRYRWTVDGKLVRAVQSAALSDVLRRGLARPGETCAARSRRATGGPPGRRPYGRALPRHSDGQPASESVTSSGSTIQTPTVSEIAMTAKRRD